MQTVNSRFFIFLISLALAVGSPIATLADLKIQLKNGRVITVPVDEADVEKFTYQKGTKPRSQAQRAADKIRQDAQQIRFASDAAKKAAAAARRADEAAKIATDAAAKANAAAEEAEKLAADARRVAHKSARTAETPLPKFRNSSRTSGGQSRRNAPSTQKGGRLLAVGKGRAYSVPSKAAKDARDGDIIEIQAGTYRGDVAVWHANDLVIRGVGGRVVLDAAGQSARGKAIWVIRGRNTTVQNIAFTGARVRDKNGAGIRLEGAGLIVRDSEFYDNEMGILTSANPESDVLIERSRFYKNTVDYPRHRRLGHNIYIGGGRNFTLRFSHVSGAQYGHNVKSRAETNRIAYNKIIDGEDGFSSYLLDLHGSERSYFIGNVFHQSAKTENSTMISIGAENPNATAPYFFTNNTFVNDRDGGKFIYRRSSGVTVLKNNILAGSGDLLIGRGNLTSNLIADVSKFGRIRSFISDEKTRPGEGELEGNILSLSAHFVDPAKMDFRLRQGSPAIDAGIKLSVEAGVNLTPLFQYQRRMKGEQRVLRGSLDIGAYEYGSD